MTMDTHSHSSEEPLVYSAEALLIWHLDMGADECIGDEAINQFEVKPARPESAAPQQSKTAPAHSSAPANPANSTNPASARAKAAPPPASTIARGNLAKVHATDAGKAASDLAASCQSLADLKTAVMDFQGCGLKRTASSTVFGEGDVSAPLMIIADPPGESEDRSGRPFSGDPGLLFDKMMKAIGMSREADLYCATVIPWRPPGNRLPNNQELSSTLPFILRQIALVQPKAILLMGDSAYKILMQDNKAIQKVRGAWTSLPLDDHSIPVLPTYHPRYLLTHPHLKRDSWIDLQMLQARISE